MTKNKKLTKPQIEKLAKEIRKWMLDNELWVDTRIYFNGKAFSTDDGHGQYAYNDPDRLFVLENEDPKRYFDYVGPILSMSFEGDLYDILNYCEAPRLEEEFRAIFAKYGLYFELGNAWNLTAVYNWC